MASICKEERGDASVLDHLEVKLWGEAKSKSYYDFWENSIKVDMSNNLQPTTSIIPHYLYKGVVFSPVGGRGTVEAQSLNLNESDILLATYPKSGSTWVQEILYNIVHKDRIDEIITEPIDLRVPFIETPICGLQTLAERPSPRLVKAHCPYDLLPKGNCDRKYKIIYCIRNPKDVVVSLYYFYKMTKLYQFNGSFKELVSLFIDGKTMYGPAGQHVLSYWNRKHHSNIHIIRYEDLHKDVKTEICRLGKFLNIELDAVTVSKIKDRCCFVQMAANPNCNHANWKNYENLADDKFAFMRKGVTIVYTVLTMNIILVVNDMYCILR
ncbi:hypothetical protein CHUAL_012803 [Chamberlinius hualienensis]